MRRLATAAVLPCSVALFIVLAPIAAADETTPSTTTAPTTTTEPGDTTTAPPTTTVPLPRGPKLIQPGVTIGGLLVGGLTKAEARELVEQRFGKPITLVVSPSKKMRVTPEELGADAYVAKAVTTAVRVRSEGFKVPLTVDVANGRLTRSSATSRSGPTGSPSTRASRCGTSSRSRIRRRRAGG